MATEAKKNTTKSGKAGPSSQEEIVSGFNDLRQQQRAIASKLSELEAEKKEHDLVIKTLADTDPERKCFRMIGGVLVERTVKEVLPALTNNAEQIGKIMENLEKSLGEKGKEINDYREKFNIRLRGEGPGDESKSEDNKSAGQGVLVAGGS